MQISGKFFFSSVAIIFVIGFIIILSSIFYLNKDQNYRLNTVNVKRILNELSYKHPLQIVKLNSHSEKSASVIRNNIDEIVTSGYLENSGDKLIIYLYINPKNLKRKSKGVLISANRIILNLLIRNSPDNSKRAIYTQNQIDVDEVNIETTSLLFL